MEAPLHEAGYYRAEDDGRVVCALCPHNCRIAPGREGFCRVRGNRDGKLIALTYGRIVASHMDPIEKKPLYHFLPGQDILSIGTAGCNLRCAFCQNWDLVLGGIPATVTPLRKIIDQAQQLGSLGIAYTYNEPGIWFEYLMDCARAAREAGLKNVLVTNGFMNPDPWAEICSVADAMNIDLKSMDPEFYKRLCKAERDPVLVNIRTAAASCHVEVTNLIVTGENDSHELIEQVIDFVASIRDTIPLHFSRYFPQHEFTAPPTPPETLDWAVTAARKKLKYVYAGNISLANASDTICPSCGALVVRRTGYRTDTSGLTGATCTACSKPVDIITS